MKMNLGLIQFTPGMGPVSVPSNRKKVVELIENAMAADVRPDLLMLPENWQATTDRVSKAKMTPQQKSDAMKEPIDGESITMLRELAKKYHVWIAAGSIVLEKVKGEKPYNSMVIIDRDGEVAAVYDKTHLCEWVHENDGVAYGSGIVPVETEFGILAPILCYDIRFQELIRGYALAGAKFLLVPACFQTNLAQWRALLQARATENQMFVLGCGCCGDNPPEFKGQPYKVDDADQQLLSGQSFVHYMGHSMVVDPTGKILAEAGDDECILRVTIDTERVEKVRAGVFYIDSLRPNAYSHYKELLK